MEKISKEGFMKNILETRHMQGTDEEFASVFFEIYIEPVNKCIEEINKLTKNISRIKNGKK